jgi:citrate lyase subunit beta/citryl-CoA lyase
MSLVPPVMLYVPATEPSKTAKALTLPAGAVILDLEDAVAPSAKPDARIAGASSLASPAAEGPQRWVRMNEVGGPHWIDDLIAVVRPGLDGIVVPKVESGATLTRLDGALAVLERDRGLGPVPLLGIIETPAGFAALDDIAGASPRLKCLGFGAGDFSELTGIAYPAVNGGAAALLTWARTQLVLVSSRAGLEPPHDSVYGRYADLDGLRAEAVFARQLGFSGKHAIHPTQLAPLNEAFAIGAAEIEQARRVVEAYERALAADSGAVGVDGLLVDEPIARRARQLLERAGER